MKTNSGFCRRIGGSLVAGALMALLAGGVSAADFTMKIGLGTYKDVQHEWANWMEQQIESASDGRIDVKVFPRSQLGNIFRMVEGVQIGTIECLVAPMDFYAGIDPRFGVFSIPVLFRNKANAARTLLDPELNAEIRTIGTGRGNIVPVSVFTHSTAHYFGKKPIRRLSDFKGLKLRVNATDAEREKMKRFGATAIPMPLSEVVPSLQRGVIDGTMSGMVVYVVFKFNQIGKVLTQTDDTLILSAGIVSKAWLDRLPPDLRQIVIDAGVGLQQRANAYSDTNEQAMLAKWRELGGSLIRLPDEDLNKVRTLLASVGEDTTGSNPELNAFYQRVRSVAAKY